MDTYTREGVMVKGKLVTHAKLNRDYCCSCGGRLVTRWSATLPNWRTVCVINTTHSPDGFMTQTAYHRLEAEAVIVFDNLPASLQAAIKGE